MTTIYRTAYPRLVYDKKLRTQELEQFFTPTLEELSYVKKKARGDNSRLGLMVLLKTFQYLGYFSNIKDINQVIFTHIKKNMPFIGRLAKINYHFDSLLYRHRKFIREYFNITWWGNIKSKAPINPVRRHALEVACNASKTMNNLADIINVVLENLRKNSYELPAFNQIDRLVMHARGLVNRIIFQNIYNKLSTIQLNYYKELLELPEHYNRTNFNALKSLPQRPTITHFRELLEHHDWLMTLPDLEGILKKVSQQKILQFAEEAKAADADIMKRMTEKKRYALISCLILKSKGQAKDSLAITFSKTIFRIHKKASEKLKQLQEKETSKTHSLLMILSELLLLCKNKEVQDLSGVITKKINDHGGAELLYADCEQAIAYNSQDYLPLLWEFYKSKRATLFKLVNSLKLYSTTQNDLLINAIKILVDNQNKKSDYLLINVNLSFVTKNWNKLIFRNEENTIKVSRRYYEMCIFSYIARELRSGDLFIDGGDCYADYRKEMLSWDACQPMLFEYCKEIEIPQNALAFTTELRNKLKEKAKNIDVMYPEIEELEINEHGEPTLKKRNPKQKTSGSVQLEIEIKKRIPKRSLTEILCNTHQHCGWAHEFFPISGFNAKKQNTIERYIATVFAYGTCMGPSEASKHMMKDMSANILSKVNCKHVTNTMLDCARTKLVNHINIYSLIKAWGDGKACAADGTLRGLREENLIAEFHMRYLQKGGIAYHHVTNNYIALFSTFIPCGVWEAVEIIEGLLKNDSDIKPDTIHADTQGQSTIVFAMAYMLGIKLMPRIRNWKDVKLFKPSEDVVYENIDSLFNDYINWKLIETHWQDIMQVVLSVKNGKVSSSLLLRKLSNYSKKNRLYKAFQELGRVIRTLFLLEYISDVKLRETITDTTNKAEAYNGLSEWVSFGSVNLVASNDPNEMEKAIKYNDIVTNSIILQNVIDMSEIIYQLRSEGIDTSKEDVSFLSPYITAHIKRFGDFQVDLQKIPPTAKEVIELTLI